MRLLLLLALLASCTARPPRTLEEAQRQYQRNKARARGNPTLIPYYRPKI